MAPPPTSLLDVLTRGLPNRFWIQPIDGGGGPASDANRNNPSAVQSTSAAALSSSRNQLLSQRAPQAAAGPPSELLVEPLDGPSDAAAPRPAPAAAADKKQRQQQKQNSLSSPVRNASGSPERERDQQQQQRLKASRLEAEFADDSIGSQASGSGADSRARSTHKSPSSQRASSLASAPKSPGGKQQQSQQQQHQPHLQHHNNYHSHYNNNNNYHHHHQHHPHAHKQALEASTSHNGEARRLLESSHDSCCWTATTTTTATGTAAATGASFRADQTDLETVFRRQSWASGACYSNSNINHSHNHNSVPSSMSSLSTQSLRLMPAYFAAELIGTFLLVLIGDGAAAAYVLTRRPVDVFCVCFAFGVGAMIASYVGAKLSGAHLNPAASLALALDSRLKWELVPVYMVAQYLGGFLAALVLFLNYSEAIGALDGGARSAFGATNSTGGIFATYPAPYVTVWGSLLDQIVGTAVLLFSLQAVGDKNNLGLEDRFQPPIVALVVGLVCLAFAPNCGAIFNPARDLSPRLLTALFGYPGVWSPIDGTYWALAGVVGPHIGAILGVFAYKYLIGASLDAHKRHMQLCQNSVVIGGAASGALDGAPPGTGSYDEKKGGARLQSFSHQLSTAGATSSTPVQQRRHELSDYGSAVIR